MSEVSVDLEGESGPVGRCSCPSRKFPCKHALGLMLAFVGDAGTFGTRGPAPDLLAKREKQAPKASKPAEPAAPKKVNAAALAKKVASQREGLDLLETLLLDLVAGGQWHEPARLERVERQGKQLGDAYPPGAAILVRRLVLLGRAEGLADEVRAARASDLFGQMWAAVRKGRDYLDGKLAGDEAPGEADAVLEDLLGRAWQLAELKERGSVKQGLELLELAHERADDDARQEQVQSSHLLDLQDGSLYRAITYKPARKAAQVAEQPSYTQPLTVGEAVVYPGFLNRRIRWEKGAEQADTLEPSHRQAAFDKAAPAFESAPAAFRQQLKNPLAPREATALPHPRTTSRLLDEVRRLADASRAASRGAPKGKGKAAVTKAVEEAARCRLADAMEDARTRLQAMAVEDTGFVPLALASGSLAETIRYGSVRRIDPAPLRPLLTQLFLRATLVVRSACLCDRDAAKEVRRGIVILRDVAAEHPEGVDAERWDAELDGIAAADSLRVCPISLSGSGDGDWLRSAAQVPVPIP